MGRTGGRLRNLWFQGFPPRVSYPRFCGVMKMRPRIGITSWHRNDSDRLERRVAIRDTYTGAVRAAGGLPIILPIGDDDPRGDRRVSRYGGRAAVHRRRRHRPGLLRRGAGRALSGAGSGPGSLRDPSRACRPGPPGACAGDLPRTPGPQRCGGRHALSGHRVSAWHGGLPLRESCGSRTTDSWGAAGTRDAVTERSWVLPGPR